MSERRNITQGWTLEEIQALAVPVPNRQPTSHLYFLFEGDDLVYVGQTTQGAARIEKHRYDKTFDRYALLDVQPDCLNDEEARYILKFRPKYNRSMPANSLYRSTNQIKGLLRVNDRELQRKIQVGELHPRYLDGLAYYTVEEISKAFPMQEAWA